MYSVGFSRSPSAMGLAWGALTVRWMSRVLLGSRDGHETHFIGSEVFSGARATKMHISDMARLHRQFKKRDWAFRPGSARHHGNGRFVHDPAARIESFEQCRTTGRSPEFELHRGRAIGKARLHGNLLVRHRAQD